MSAHFQQFFHSYFSFSLFSVCCLNYTCISLNTDQVPYFLTVINQFSNLVMSNSLWPYVLQHARPPCPSPMPGVYSNSCPLSWWRQPTISSSVIQHQGLFQWVNSSHQVAKVLEFQLQHQSFQWNPGLISFGMDWLDLLAVQRTLKALIQHHSSKASILLCSAFFIVQLSHPYMTTRKTITFTRWNFLGKVTSAF